MKFLQKIFLLTVFIFQLNPSFAAIKVTPTLIELDANNAKGDYLTTSFMVQAENDETIRFKLYPEYFTITDEGKMNSIVDSKNKDNLVPHVRFVPNEFTLKNGSKQLVRVTFTDLKNLPEGESRMVMFIEDVKAKEIMLPNKTQNINTRLIVKTRLGIPFYADKGRYVKAGSFNNLEVMQNEKNLVYKIDLSSKGNSKIRYTGKGQIIQNGNLVGEFRLNGNTVRGGGIFSETKALPENLKEGNYTLRVILTYKNEKGENKNLIKETPFTITDSI